MNLFFIYIGGSIENSLVELHDVRFCFGETIEDTYDSLRKSWWGTPESLHLDCWGMVKSVENYHVHIKETPSADTDKKLYFVNLGGYDDNQFTELHKNILVVASSEAEAKVKAVKQISDWTSPHRDYFHQVEKIFSLHDIAEKEGFYINLELTENPEPFKFTCTYRPIGK